MRLQDGMTFAHYYSGKNALAVHAVQNLSCYQSDTPQERLLYLWSSCSMGRSHLLQACALEVLEQGYRSVYIPLKNIAYFSLSILENLEDNDMICIDDIDMIAGYRTWEESFFHLFNRCEEKQVRLIFSASSPVRDLVLQLQDLKSRLGLAPVFQLHAFSDEEKMKALQFRAKARGLDLNDDVAEFLLRRSHREMQDLMQILDRLDQSSWQENRKLSIPFVKATLSW